MIIREWDDRLSNRIAGHGWFEGQYKSGKLVKPKLKGAKPIDRLDRPLSIDKSVRISQSGMGAFLSHLS